MTTRHLLLARAIAALLELDPPVAGKVYSARTRPVPTGVLTAVNVRLVGSSSQLGATIGGRTSWATLIAVECYGSVDGGSSSDEAADPVIEAVFERLASDPSLGGQAMSVEPLEGDTLAWDFDALDTNMACVTAKFVVRHQTTGRTLTQ